MRVACGLAPLVIFAGVVAVFGCVERRTFPIDVSALHVAEFDPTVLSEGVAKADFANQIERHRFTFQVSHLSGGNLSVEVDRRLSARPKGLGTQRRIKGHSWPPPFAFWEVADTGTCYCVHVVSGSAPGVFNCSFNSDFGSALVPGCISESYPRDGDVRTKLLLAGFPHLSHRRAKIKNLDCQDQCLKDADTNQANVPLRQAFVMLVYAISVIVLALGAWTSGYHRRHILGAFFVALGGLGVVAWACPIGAGWLH